MRVDPRKMKYRKATAHTFVENVPRTEGALTSSTHKVWVMDVVGQRALCLCGQGRTQYYNVSQLNFTSKKKGK